MDLFNPVSTYRIQFNKNFSFRDTQKIISYLEKLGIGSIYASPVLQAEPGSMHGYDVTDPLRLNNEIGDDNDFNSLIEGIHKVGIGWIQDFVPNHMAYSPGNPWIYDLLRKGKDSRFYDFFDIIRDHPEPELRDKIMLPFFGKDIDEVAEDGEIKLILDERGFQLKYFENKYPISDNAYPWIINSDSEESLPEELISFLDQYSSSIIADEAPERVFLLNNENESVNKYLNGRLQNINDDPEKLKILISKLNYKPVHWKETEKRINFRRFFTINSLICLNIQDDKVFRNYHKFLHHLIETNMINGVRIDHIDGLADPSSYLESLRKLAGNETYIVVEKILEEGEKLPDSWPVEGSTGYDFLAMVNNLLTNKKHGKELYSYYREWSQRPKDIHDYLHEKKRFILHNRLKGELDVLVHQCMSMTIDRIHKTGRDELMNAIGEFMVYCPVYKIYSIPSDFMPPEKKMIRDIFSQAKESNSSNREALEMLESLFLLKDIHGSKPIGQVDEFFRRCMQFTGPLMAKGVEDTAFYSFNPFIAYNEVGDNPGYFGISTGEFHELMKERREKFPLAMNTIATHDTKRGDDARSRMNVLSDLPEEWKEITSHWREINHEYKQDLNGQPVPTDNDEYFIYQTLCAHLPMDGKPDEDFIPRLEEYLVKAFREAKVKSSWSEPDTDYEEKTLQFINNILDENNPFYESFLSFTQKIIPHGIINSITQTILKNTVPGVPDTYQGGESWNLSFVDPDNRRPVDYPKLEQDLDRMISDYEEDPIELTKRVWAEPVSGKIKHWASYLALRERKSSPELFSKGEYLPLKVKGKYKDHIIAFMRCLREEYLLVVLPLNTASLPSGAGWDDTRIKLPDVAPPIWENRFTREQLKTSGKLLISDIFNELPAGILKGKYPEPERKAGILLHISSLPGNFGIGDFGPASMKFIDFLYNSGQKYWQILPLSQSDRLTSYSPYSSYSAFAGNTLFIDPIQLRDEGYLSDDEVKEFKTKSGDKVDYNYAEKVKTNLLNIAFERYNAGEKPEIRSEFEAFKEKEDYWINDFALFLALKKHHDYKPWNEWPLRYRERKDSALQRFSRKYRDEINRIIFGQFMFSKQWDAVRRYAADRGVKIFGDIPIYIDYDSADVWANPDLFLLDADRSMKAVAGVPPDYFNENGQLWGMPLFDWKAMKENGYSWWLNRIRKNLEWFDLLRLDHFRGFSAYWEVPAEDEVALYGKWVKGPGNDLFDKIREKFPEMPLVAEDLGQIDQPVYDLRDDYNLPGMRVIQFGFGGDMPYSQHTPANFNNNSITYTGTHDNNTMKGWFRKEADKTALKNFKKYTGVKLKKKNCHTEMIRLAYATVSRLVIIPLQDWLGLDEKSRMNFPSTTEGNWLWRVKEDQMSAKLEKKILKKVKVFGRI